jgi:hypothetical protein
MIHDIPAKSRLLPVIPITSPQFVYRRARETDVRLTFARARLESSSERDWLAEGGVLAPRRVLPRES